MPEKQAILDKLKGSYLDVVTTLRNDFIDEIPAEIVTQDDPNYYFYKCRKNFFVEIMGITGLILRDGVVISPDAAKQALEYMDYVKNEIPTRERITKEDIDKGNSILDMLIKELSKKDN